MGKGAVPQNMEFGIRLDNGDVMAEAGTSAPAAGGGRRVVQLVGGLSPRRRVERSIAISNDVHLTA